VYFSQGNATRAVAEDLAALTGADLEAIVELKNRSGFFGFMGAGMDASLGTATPITGPFYNPARYDVVFVCTPVWSWHLSPPVRSWLRMYSGKLRKAAFVSVSGDTEPDKIVAAMVEESGTEPFAFDGFSESDLYPESRASYVARLAALVEPLR
jgi:flavodoxin